MVESYWGHTDTDTTADVIAERRRQDVQDLAEMRASLVELKGEDYVTRIEEGLAGQNRDGEIPNAIMRHLAHARVDAQEDRGFGFQM